MGEIPGVQGDVIQTGWVEGGINIGCVHCFTMEVWYHAHKDETGHDCAPWSARFGSRVVRLS